MNTTGPSRWGWSMYGSFSRCPRAFALRYRAGVEDAPGGPRGLGSLVHAMFAHRYDRKMGKTVPPLEEVVQETAARVGCTPDQVDLAREVYADYSLHAAAERWRPILAEEELTCAFVPRADGGIDVAMLDEARIPSRGKIPGVGDHVPYSARIDLGVEDRAGKVKFLDHKTTAYIRQETFARYGMSGQMHGHWWLGRLHYGDRFDGVVVNAVQTKAGRRKDGSRGVCKPPPGAPKLVEDFPRVVVQLAREIAWWDSTAGGDWRRWRPAMHDLVCMHSYGPCEYTNICRG